MAEQERVGFIGLRAMGAHALLATALETYSMAMTTHGDEDSARIAAYINDVSG
ncbi:MAG: hypothetical protein M3Y74_03920 [Chloroflexota bacterium]|nr:hypothetical protein [Chloroflexota bacterium]